jgi:mRNA-degrading endonuclease toxin of MazEF toxin-antitoxin module
MTRIRFTTTSSFGRGSVYYVPFVFTDGARAKNRPAVIVSSAAYHSSRNEVIFAGITSNVVDRGFVGQVPIGDWQACGLKKPSVVSGLVMTIHASRLGRHLGELTASDKQALDKGLRASLGL